MILGGRGSNSGMMKTLNGKTVMRFNTPLKAGNPYKMLLRIPKAIRGTQMENHVLAVNMKRLS